MKTRSIVYRVADFLKEYPPFSFLPVEVIRDLAGHGRVRFHEANELIFEEGQTRDREFYVLQQGTVRIVRQEAGKEILVDLRGPGDMIGISYFLSKERYVHTARTASDTLLYALPWEAFLPLVRQYREVSRYLASYFSLRPTYMLPDPDQLEITEQRPLTLETTQDWLVKGGSLEGRARHRLLCVPPTQPVSDVARKMAHAWLDAVVVVDERRHPLGVVTETDLCEKVATGMVPLESPVSVLMSHPVLTACPGLPPAEIMLEMIRNHLRHICLTEDGTDTTPVVGLISERDIQVLHGRLPTYLGKEIAKAQSTEELSKLRDRIEELLLGYLETHTSLSWAGEMVAELDRCILMRAVHLAGTALLREGYVPSELPFAWLSLGAEGRKERLLRTRQQTALVFADPPEGEEDAARTWYNRLGERVTALLAEIGHEPCPHGLVASNPFCCRSLSEWHGIFHQWIQNPSGSNTLARMPFFDLQLAAGSPVLVEQLRAGIREALVNDEQFIRVVARRALENLPPVTIFQNSVLDQSGVLWTCIDTRLHALDPLVQVARLFSLAEGAVHVTATSQRFLAAAARFPEHARLLEDGAEACRVMLYHQALAGLRHRSDGQYIRPNELSKADQEIIKSVFRTVGELLEFTAGHFTLKEPVLS